MVIVEGLNLSNVMRGFYDLYCLPLKIAGSDGAPARAILISAVILRTAVRGSDPAAGYQIVNSIEKLPILPAGFCDSSSGAFLRKPTAPHRVPQRRRLETRQNFHLNSGLC